MITYIKTMVLTASITLISFLSPQSFAAFEVNMPQGVTAISQEIYHLHMLIFWTCVVIGLLVFSVMFWSIFFHRKSRGYKPAQFHENTLVEIIWTAIPFLILIAMAFPATKTLLSIYNTDDADIDIKIIGYQWKWKYEYLDEKVSFFSHLATSPQEMYGAREKNPNYLLDVDEPLVLPIGKKVRFLVTAGDVIHSWWVPEFALKRDAIPGFINEAWVRIDKPGTYRGQCAELCGKDHGFMPIVVEAKTEEDYQKWLTQKKIETEQIAKLNSLHRTKEELMAHGEKVYQQVCAVCHELNGRGQPPMYPSLVKTSLTQKIDCIADHINIVLNGIDNTAMQPFAHQLQDAELSAVITYERNAWGNNTGDLIQAKDIFYFKQTGLYNDQEPLGTCRSKGVTK